jgi:predicted transcriptional regulator
MAQYNSWSVAILMFVFILLIMPIASSARQTAALTTVTITLDDSDKDADVAQGAVSITFTGKVAVTTTADENIVVNLAGYADDWDTTVVPAQMIFTESDIKTFRFIVHVPSDALAGEYIVKVDACWHYESEPEETQVKSVQALVTVIQYYKIELLPERFYVEVAHAEELNHYYEYNIIIYNRGNGEDTFSFNKDCPSGWSLNIEPISVKLQPFTNKIIKLTFISHTLLTDGVYRFNLTARSEGSAGTDKIFVCYPLYVYVQIPQLVIVSGNQPVLIVDRPGAIGKHIGTLQAGEQKLIALRVRCFIQSTAVKLNYEILSEREDRILLPENNVTIEHEPISLKLTAGSYGTFRLKLTCVEEFVGFSDRIVLITVQAVGDDTSTWSNRYTMELLLLRSTERHERTTWIPFPLSVETSVLTVTLTIAAVLSFLSAGTEWGKYKLLCLLFVPLYTKIHEDNVLDHFTRGRIYEYIRTHPGVHFNAIKRELNLNNGGLAYHLRLLEKIQLIKSERAGIYRLFYPTGMPVPKELGPRLTDTELFILEKIRAHPGISQTKLALMVADKKQRTVSHYIKQMARDGMIKLVRAGKETKCYLNVDRS